MEYSNPEIPEGINVSKVNPLKELLTLSLGVLGTIIIAVFILGFLAERLAVYVPFSTEKQLLSGKLDEIDSENPAQQYLQEISDNIAAQMNLPEDMDFTVHYIEEPVQNAYATIGGHIYIYQGLMELLPSENALAMVIAHEMGHIYHRHPIMALGRGVVIGLLLATIAGISGDYFVGQLVNSAGIITLLTFNREQEREADRTALAAIAARYGHIADSDVIFRKLHDMRDEYPVYRPKFLSTHPLYDERVKYLKDYAEQNGWNVQGPIAALPEEFKKTDGDSN